MSYPQCLLPPISHVVEKTISDDQARHVLDVAFLVSTHSGFSIFHYLAKDFVEDDMHQSEENLMEAYRSIIAWQHIIAYRNTTGTDIDPRIVMAWVGDRGTMNGHEDAEDMINEWATTLKSQLEVAHEEVSTSYTKKEDVARFAAHEILHYWNRCIGAPADVPLAQDVQDYIERFLSLVEQRIDEYVHLIQYEKAVLDILVREEAKTIEQAKELLA